MALDPLQELKRRRSQALTPVADPLDELKRRKSLMQDTALSPLLEEAPFPVERPTAGAGPRRGMGALPAVEVTAPAPKPFEKKLARALMEGTRKAEPFGGEEELTPEQQQQLRRAVTSRAMAEDIGKAVVGQPERTVYRTATGIAKLRGDERAARLEEQMRKVEQETAPETGVGGVVRLASEIAAMAPSGLAAGAIRSGLESAAGKEFGISSRVSEMLGRGPLESPMARALADAAINLAIPGAIEGARTAKAIRGVGSMAGDAFTQGLREGVREAVDAATPSLVSNAPRMTAPRGAPQSNIMRLLPARAGTLPPVETGPVGPAIPATAPRVAETRPSRMLPAEAGRTVPLGTEPAPVTGAVQGPAIPTPQGITTPAGPVSSLSRLLAPQSEALRQRLFMMPAAPEAVREAAAELPNIPKAGRRTGAAAEAVRAAERNRPAFQMPPAAEASPEDIAKYLTQRKQTPTTVAERMGETAEERILRTVNEQSLIGTPSRVRERLRATGRIGPRAENVPLERIDETALQRALTEVEGEIRPPRGERGEIPPVDQDMEDWIAREIAAEKPAGKAPKAPAAVEPNKLPDNTIKFTDEEARNLELVSKEAGQPKIPTSPKSLSKLTMRQLQAMKARAELQIEEATPLSEWFNTAGLEITEAGGGSGRTRYNRYGERVIDKNGKILTSPSRLNANGAYTEDELSYAFDNFGLDAFQYHDMVISARKAANVESAARSGIDRINEELARRGHGPEVLEYTPVSGAPGILKQFLSEESGAIAPRAATTLGGFATGAATGIATDEEGGMTPLQRALLYGAAGAAGGAAAGKYLTRTPAGRAAPSISELGPVAATINVGERAAVKAGPSMFEPAPFAPRGGVLGALQEKVEPAIAWTVTKARKAYNGLISETYALEQAAKKFGTPAQAADMPGLIAQQQGARRAAKGYLEDTLTPIIKDLTPEEKESVRALLKARRDLQIRQRGGAAKSAVTIDELQRGVAAGNANPKIAQAADQITAMHRNLLDMRHQAGLLSDEAYDAIKASDDFYTPLFREIASEEAGTLPGARGGRFNIFSSGVRKMDRTAEALEQTADPLEMVIADAARTYRDVGRQKVANVIFDLADTDKLPFIKKIQADPTNPPKRDGIIQQTRNGKLYTYEVTDPDLYNALAGQDHVATNALVKYGNILKNIKTAGITILPDFAAANVIRDVAMSGIQRPDVARAAREAAIGAGVGGVVGASQTKEGESAAKNFLIGAGLGAGAGLYARPFSETMAAVKSIVLPKGVNVMGKQLIAPDDLFREFLASGASTEGFYVRNANDAAKLLKELERDPGFSASDIIIPKNWWETLRKVGSVAEQATRVAAYRQVKEATGDAAAAALAAQDRTLRFANIGGSKTVKDLAAITPFWNAKLQGWDKLGRMLKDPKTWGLGAGMLTAPSIALWSVNKDNPEYWERPTWEKNLFWLIPKSVVGQEGDKGFYRIPKPFELGYMFASLPERALDYFTQAGVDIPLVGEIQSAAPRVAKPGDILARAAQDMATSTFEGTIPDPAGASTVLQLMANRDFFRNRPIVTKPNLPTELQDTRESSAVARALSQVGISPEKTDFAIRSTFGTVGSEASKLADIAARKMGKPAPEPPAGAAQVPFLGRFAERFSTNTRGQTDPEAMARERLRELARVEAGFREVKRRGDRGKLLDYVRENATDLELAQRIQPIETDLEKLSTLRTKVLNTPGISPDDRQKMLEILRARGQKLSETLMGVPER